MSHPWLAITSTYTNQVRNLTKNITARVSNQMIIFPPQKNNASALRSKTCKHKNCVKLYVLQVPDKAEQQQAALLDGMVLYAK